MRRRLGILIFVLAGALTACGGTATPKADAPSAPTSSPTSSATSSPTSSPSSASLSPDAAVAAVSLRRTDLPAGYSGDIMRGGDQVDGQVTLDMCGYAFSSESMRVARKQVAFQNGNPNNHLSSEVVAYQPGGVDTAMKEIAAAIASCPRGYIDSYVSGEPPSKQVVTKLPARPTWQPGTIALRMSVTAKTGQHLVMFAVFQHQGDLLGAVYAFGTSVKDMNHAADLVSTRLAHVAYSGSQA